MAFSDNKSPRLVVDSSICGVNNRCSIPEKTTLPSAQDVMRVYPLRNSNEPMVGFSLDIKSAHKLVVIRESDRGLLGFTLDGAIYFYKVMGPLSVPIIGPGLAASFCAASTFYCGGHTLDSSTLMTSFSCFLKRLPGLCQACAAF